MLLWRSLNIGMIIPVIETTPKLWFWSYFSFFRVGLPLFPACWFGVCYVVRSEIINNLFIRSSLDFVKLDRIVGIEKFSVLMKTLSWSPWSRFETFCLSHNSFSKFKFVKSMNVLAESVPLSRVSLSFHVSSRPLFFCISYFLSSPDMMDILIGFFWSIPSSLIFKCSFSTGLEGLGKSTW